LGQYYDLIMNPVKGSFSAHFNECWSALLDEFAVPYADAVQLRIGNQLRPKLTCWGAAFNTDNANELDLKNIAFVAAYIEMLHKASIIIDDMVDGDDARHGKKAFHIEFGRDRAQIFALALLGKGLAGINTIFENSKAHFRSVDLYSNTIYKMAMGGLEELNLDASTRFDVEKVNRIINLETISLIKNSMVLGYWSNFDTQGSSIEDTIVEIGSNCGYIFQILNDLEPFSSLEKNMLYKGGQNIDINRDRKNIAVAYIFGAATKKEKKHLLELEAEHLQMCLFDLYTKYSVYDRICAEARALERESVALLMNSRDIYPHTASFQDFQAFITDMVDICFSKLR